MSAAGETRDLPIVSCPPTVGEWSALQEFYGRWFQSICRWIVERYERRDAYDFLDLKFDVIRSRDFPETDRIRGLDAVYLWIQGRGLESLVGHALWLSNPVGARPSHEDESLIDRISAVVMRLANTLRSLVERHEMSVPFCVDRAGRTRFDISPKKRDRGVTYADLFVARGLVAAGCHLNDHDLLEFALSYLERIEGCVFDNQFTSGQPNINHLRSGPNSGLRRVEVSETQTARLQGPHMILLGSLAFVLEHRPEHARIESGIRIIDHVVRNHVALTPTSGGFLTYDMWEKIDHFGRPLTERGRVVCDPGHSIEFAGAAAKFLRLSAGQRGRFRTSDPKRLHYGKVLTGILQRSFARGFRKSIGGIVKQVDLISHATIDSSLPWWSLPETMRTAVELAVVSSDERDKRDLFTIFAQSHNAFCQGYVKPGSPALWVQTRDSEGLTVDVIPACPDVDPGYHTNLSILDALELAASNAGE